MCFITLLVPVPDKLKVVLMNDIKDRWSKSEGIYAIVPTLPIGCIKKQDTFVLFESLNISKLCTHFYCELLVMWGQLTDI